MKSCEVIMPVLPIRAVGPFQLHSLQRAADRVSEHCSNCHLRQCCQKYMRIIDPVGLQQIADHS